jgi:hypothetical protein
MELIAGGHNSSTSYTLCHTRMMLAGIQYLYASLMVLDASKTLDVRQKEARSSTR